MISPELLRRFALFAGLEPGDFSELAMMCEEDTFKTGEILFGDGDEADDFYLLLEGQVELKALLNAEAMTYQDITTLVPGEGIGWSALVEPYTYTMTATAVSPVRVIVIDAVELREYMQKHPAKGFVLMSRVAQMLGERLTNMRIRLASLIAP